MEQFTYKGVWWLPENVERTASGTVIFSPTQGITLEIVGAFSDDPFQLFNPDVVLGVVEGGRPVTLQVCHVTSSEIGGPVQQGLRANFCVLGAHVKSVDAQQYERFYVDVEQLADWCTARGIQPTVRLREPREIRVEYTFPEEEIYETKPATVSLVHGMKTNRSMPTSFTLEWRPAFCVRPRNAVTFNEYLERFGRPLQELIALAADSPVEVAEVTGVLPRSEGQQERSQTVSLFYHPMYVRRTPREAALASKLIFRQADLPDMADSLQAWLSAWEEIRSPLRLFFTAQYESGMYLDQRFIYHVQVLEAYHRGRIGGQVMDEKEHDVVVRAAVEAVPPNHQEWLRIRLRYSNEPSLRRRLKDLVAQNEGIIGPIVPSLERFVSLAVDTRNYFTHHDASLRDRAAKSGTLYKLTEAVRYLGTACLMSELRFEPQQIEHLLSHHPRYQYACRVRDSW